MHSPFATRILPTESCGGYGLSLDMTPVFKTIMPFDSATVTISNTRGEEQKLGHLRQQEEALVSRWTHVGCVCDFHLVERPKFSNDVLYAHGFKGRVVKQSFNNGYVKRRDIGLVVFHSPAGVGKLPVQEVGSRLFGRSSGRRKMPPANESSNVGLIFDAIAKDAWDSFLKDDHQRAQRLARQLLSQSRLGNVLKAAMHMIMATGSEQYMSHATQAVKVYEHLFDNIENPPIADRRWRGIALEHARELQEKAKEDQLAFQNHIKTHYGSSDAAKEAFIKRYYSRWICWLGFCTAYYPTTLLIYPHQTNYYFSFDFALVILSARYSDQVQKYSQKTGPGP